MKKVKRGASQDTFTPQTVNASTWLPFKVYVEQGHSEKCLLITGEREGAEGDLWRLMESDDMGDTERETVYEWRDSAGTKRGSSWRWVRFVCACAPRYCEASVLVRCADISTFIQQVAGTVEEFDEV